MLVVLILVADADMPRLNNTPLAPACQQAIFLFGSETSKNSGKCLESRTITGLGGEEQDLASRTRQPQRDQSKSKQVQ
jgi:hypothetical protein